MIRRQRGAQQAVQVVLQCDFSPDAGYEISLRVVDIGGKIYRLFEFINAQISFVCGNRLFIKRAIYTHGLRLITVLTRVIPRLFERRVLRKLLFDGLLQLQRSELKYVVGHNQLRINLL